jgi:hypothetical protein
MRIMLQPVRKAVECAKSETLPALGDLRFRNLLSREDWMALPQAVRARFSKRLAGGATILYVGEVLATRLSRVGWLFAQAARLIGAPLPLSTDAHVPAVVTITEDVATGGQMWTRLYARRNGFPQVIHSSKGFAGPTGLEEYVGRGVGMALTVHVKDGALLFCSAGYFLRIGAWRIRLPAWLTPGALTVIHQDKGCGRFLFILEILHPWFGEIVRQSAMFQEAKP